MTNEKQLKACPFCESNVLDIENTGTEKFKSFAIVCNECGSSSGSYTHKYQAIEAWNKRK